MGGASSTYVVSPPTAAVVEPGNCFFGEEWTTAPLLSKSEVSHDTRVFTFGLPDDKSLGLSTCACILARGAVGENGDPVIRPYTPVSTNAMEGQFELLIKIYPDGIFTQHLEAMEIGEEIEFKHIPFNVKIQYPFGKNHIVMLVGGTGISPMIQALHAILGTEGDSTKVTMLFGNKTQDDILAKDFLDHWSEAYPDQLSVTHILSNEPEDSNWEGIRGLISKEIIQENSPPPADDMMFFICGPPGMYEAFCGARDKKEVTGILAELGYGEQHVFKF